MTDTNRGAAQPARAKQHTVIPPGTVAPDFALRSTPDQNVRLSELIGRPVILAFYPADWSPVCGDELVLFNELCPEFERYGAALLGISVDGPWCHLAFKNDRRLRFPLLSDLSPRATCPKRTAPIFTARA